MTAPPADQTIATRVPPALLADGLPLLAALLLAAVTLTYPFGADQGLFHYVGREWLHGALPYRDTFEQKTPLIYLVYAIPYLAFGEHLWGIRLVELAWVLSVGWTVGALAVPQGQRHAPGLRGCAALVAVILYFGYFDYWNSAQPEIYCSGLALLSLFAVARLKAWRFAALGGGLLGGLTVLMKPPALLLLAAPIAGILGRALGEQEGSRRRVGRGAAMLLWFALGALLPAALAVGYFFALRALPAAIDVLVHANRHYLTYEAADATLKQFLTRTRFIRQAWVPQAALVGLLGLLGLAARLWQRSAGRGRYAQAGLLLLGGGLCIYVQHKFYIYHFAVLTFPLLFLWAVAAHDLAELVRRRPAGLARWACSLVPLGCAVPLLWLFLAQPAGRDYLKTTEAAADYLFGTSTRDRYLVRFVYPDFHFSWRDDEAIGKWIAEHSTPADLIAVRGFHPGIYAVAHRRAPTRFFWTNWLVDPRRNYRRQEWLAEDWQALLSTPPRYVVVLTGVAAGPDSYRTFLPLGYRRVFQRGSLTVLERPSVAIGKILMQPSPD